MEKKNNAVIKKVIIIVCTVILLVGAVFLAKFFIDKNNDNGDVTQNSTTEPIETTEPEPRPDYSEYVAQNPETVGWITIPGTNINAPVLQTVDNDYYMNHNFEQESEYRGAIFMDYRNNSTELDANTIIYGHNSYDGKVFSDLAQYDDIEFYKEHPMIEFNTLDKYYQWKIYAVFITNQIASEDNGYVFNFIYPHMEGPNFKGYVEELNKRTLYYTGVDIKDGDRILTLSSCCRNLDLSNYRAKTSIVVVARAVRPGEDPTVDVSQAYVNENPKYPQLYYKKHGLENPFKNDEKWYPVEVK